MARIPEPENVTPVPTAPPTPGTPGAPLFSFIRVDSLSYDRKSMPHCKCFAVGQWTPNHTCFTDFPKPTVSLTKKLGAEFVGTFLLIFFATAAPIVNEKYDHAETLIGNAGSAGLAVMIIILSTGHISGAHLNPAVTLGFASFRHFPWMQVPAYIAAQVSGSVCACFLLKVVFHPFMHGGVTVPSVSVWQAFLLEFIITFNLMFVVTAIATHRHTRGWGVGWNRCGCNCHAQHLDCRAWNRRSNEPCEGSGSGHSSWKLQRDLDLHRRTACGRRAGCGHLLHCSPA